MLEFNTKAFYEATTEAQHTLTHIESNRLESLRRHPDGSITINHIQDEVFLDVMLQRAEKLHEQLSILGAVSTLDTVDRLLVSLTAKLITYEELKSEYHEISSRLRDDLKRTMVFALDDRDKRYFAPRTPHFGTDFDSRFKTLGVFELDEAAKCMAFARPTAAVFHLMRVLEVGIHALAACLGIPDPVKPAERNWAIILRKIMDDGIANKWPSAAARMNPDAVLFESLHASLDAVKNPWRNATMHVETKYTDDEAEHIFVSVKGFMKKLASRMDENGEPGV